jgi:thioredoxin-dependent peroxiredoxin
MTDIGDSIPHCALTRPDGSSMSAADFEGQPWVLYFYPKDDTTGCTKEAQEFSAQLAAFQDAGVQVLGVSKDPPKKHLKFIEKYGLTVPLASDAETDGLAEAMGVWIEKSMYGKKYMGMDRSTFLVGKDGKVAKVWRKVKVAGHVDEVLAAAQAL